MLIIYIFSIIKKDIYDENKNTSTLCIFDIIQWFFFFLCVYTFNWSLHASKRTIFTFPRLPFNHLLIKSDRRAFIRFLPSNHHTLNLITVIIKHIINIRGLYNTQSYEKNIFFFSIKKKLFITKLINGTNRVST